MGAVFAAALAIGFVATWGMRVLVGRAGILDRPNVRSSHTRPTPTLGGVGMIAGMWGGLAFGYGALGLAPLPGWEALAGSTLVLCALAYDEVRAMGWLAKLAVQVLACALLVSSGVVLHRLVLPGAGEVALGVAAYPLTVLWLVGLQNLYNFMDGIDGLAGLEGVLVAALVGGVTAGAGSPLAPAAFALAGGGLGFLVWNRPPARIFMGDVGGHFLGLAFGAMAILGEGTGAPFWLVTLFLGAFLFDSMYTILRRIFRGENITQAHRFHLYQRLNRLGWSPGRIDRLFGITTLLLGGSGYLYMYGYPGPALGVGCGAAALMVAGTVWVELRWRGTESGEGD